MSKKKSGRGGYRPGAGRKSNYGEPLEPFGIALPPKVVKILDNLAGDRSRSETILDLLGKAHRPIRDVLKQTAK